MTDVTCFDWAEQTGDRDALGALFAALLNALALDLAVSVHWNNAEDALFAGDFGVLADSRQDTTSRRHSMGTGYRPRCGMPALSQGEAVTTFSERIVAALRLAQHYVAFDFSLPVLSALSAATITDVPFIQSSRAAHTWMLTECTLSASNSSMHFKPMCRGR